jgi:hypothetical protein
MRAEQSWRICPTTQVGLHTWPIASESVKMHGYRAEQGSVSFAIPSDLSPTDAL